MSADVYLDPLTGDLPASLRFATPVELILQRIRLRMETFLGEVLLDQRKGMPFLRWRETKQPPLPEVLSYVRREVEGVPGVLRTANPDIRTEDRGGGVEVVVVRLDVVIPYDDAMRVRIDLFGAGLGSVDASGYSTTTLTGSDPVDVNASSMPVVQIIVGTLG